MKNRALYSLALELMESTNPYRIPVEELSFPVSYYSDDDIDRKYFCDYLRRSLELQEGDKNRKRSCLLAISEALEDYLIAYPASYSYKQRLRKGFKAWIEMIKDSNNIQNVDLSDWDQDADMDKIVAMIKALHDRGGVTRAELADSLKMSQRAVHKNLRRLDPTLIEEENEKPQEAFHIGGYPVEVKIKAWRKKDQKQKSYRTVNTLHPIILQENLTQTATLLKALAKSYFDEENSVSLSIATDIWCQLSDYARERIQRYFTIEDDDFADFLEILSDETPDGHQVGFVKEKDMIENYDNMSKRESLEFLLKAPGRHADLVIHSARGLHDLYYQKISMRLDGGERSYLAISESGEITRFTYEQLESITIIPD